MAGSTPCDVQDIAAQDLDAARFRAASTRTGEQTSHGVNSYSTASFAASGIVSRPRIERQPARWYLGCSSITTTSSSSLATIAAAAASGRSSPGSAVGCTGLIAWVVSAAAWTGFIAVVASAAPGAACGEFAGFTGLIAVVASPAPGACFAGGCVGFAGPDLAGP